MSCFFFGDMKALCAILALVSLSVAANAAGERSPDEIYAERPALAERNAREMAQLPSERAAAEKYPYLTQEELRFSLPSERASMNAANAAKIAAERKAQAEAWCEAHPAECAQQVAAAAVQADRQREHERAEEENRQRAQRDAAHWEAKRRYESAIEDAKFRRRHVDTFGLPSLANDPDAQKYQREIDDVNSRADEEARRQADNEARTRQADEANRRAEAERSRAQADAENAARDAQRAANRAALDARYPNNLGGR
jgi:hypothetical protein